MRTKKLVILTAVLIVGLTSNSYAQFGWLKEKVNSLKSDTASKLSETSLDDTELGKGLKEALKVGINNAVDQVSEDGGYLNNEDIMIPLPSKLRFLDKALRKIGMGDKIDEFVSSMNKAAESAAPAARDIFLDALFDMNITDAKNLFEGGETAATDYFKNKTYDDLSDAFRPTVDKYLEKYDVTDKYDALIEKYKTIPFTSKVKMLSPDDYVINNALEGLFTVLGQEEAKIRQNPAARVTDLLKKVFK